ncbi:hypothetical protein [Rhodoblastus sp.]|jgi:hypothetical protein|uniref:hypothetical protein n=1 Tax=Rhodoblastus sp. TaxID=1962975 RepID=UPI0025F86CD6|nr:hypothetical protein [Rhodoblastus sp.]
MKLRTFVISAVLFSAPSLAFAHAAKIGEHGGQQTDASVFHVEVVAKDTKLEVYLHDHSTRAVPSAGLKGVAIFKAVDGKPVRIPLESAGDNELTGVSPSPLPAQLEGAVQITTLTGSVVQGKFVAHDHDDHEHEAEHVHVH